MPTPPNRRDFPAKRVDPFTLMEIVMRAVRGESYTSLAKEYGVSQPSVSRWVKAHRAGYDRFVEARAHGYTQKDLEQILDMLGVLRGQVTRMEAVLTRIVRPNYRYKSHRHAPTSAQDLKRP